MKLAIFPKVTVIVVNWNGSVDTLACLGSLREVIYPAFEVLLVDNGSIDFQAETIRTLFPEITLAEMGRNLGFVGANNAGLELAQERGAEYALLLNNDTEVSPDFLNRLVEAAQSAPDVGAVGPTIYYHSQPQTIWSAGGAIDWHRGSTRMLRIGEEDHGASSDIPYEVDFVTGCAMLVKMEVVRKIGPLDARFFAYYEETEWCVRMRKAGYRILQVPQAHVWHKISPQARESSPVVHYYMTRNRLLFLKLSQAGARPWLYTLFLDYGRTLLSWSVRPRWRGKSEQRQAMLQAIQDYRRGRFWQWVPR